MAKYKKRKDGRYARQVTLGIRADGSLERKTIYGKTIAELEANYNDFITLKNKGIILRDQSMRFSELSMMWMENTKKGEIKEQSYNNLMSQIRILNSKIGHIKVKDLNTSHIENLRLTALESGKIDQYNKSLSMIRNILDYAATKDLVTRNITHGLKRVTYSGKREKRSLTLEERQLIEHADLNEFEYCFMSTLLYTGMRRAEALALVVNDLDFKNGNITVNKTLVLSKPKNDILQKNTKTSAGARILPIPEPLYPILKDYCKNRVGILFENNNKEYMTTPSFIKRWKKILKKLEAANGGHLADDITPHIFRHTYASDLYKAGVDIKTAQYLLGHTDIKTTLDTYTHFGYVDVRIDSLEDYYKSTVVKMQSNRKIIPLKAVK